MARLSLRRPRLSSLRRRGVLALGIALTVGGGLTALAHGPDDTVMIATERQSIPDAGLPTVVRPFSIPFRGAELVVRAEAREGVFLASAHRIDMTDLLDGVSGQSLESLGVTEGTFLSGFPVRVDPRRIVGWRERSAGPGPQEVRVDLHGDPLDVLAVSLSPDATLKVSYGVHVASVFAGSLGFAGAGLLLVLAWSAAGRGRRRPEEAEPAPESLELRESLDPADPALGSPVTRRLHGPLPPPVIQPVTAPVTRPLAQPAPTPATPTTPPVERPVEDAAGHPAEDRAEDPVDDRDDPDDPDDSESQDTPDDRDEPPSRPPTGTRPLRSGAAALAATLAVGWWARRRRRGTTALLLGALLLGGCGFTDERDPVDLKPGLEQGASEEMLADYARRLTRAVRWSTGPKDDDSRWERAQAGPALAASQWRVATDAQPPRRRAARPRLRTAGVHTPMFRGYPMWAAVEVEEGSDRSLVVFTRAGFADPWLAAVSIGLDDVTVPAPAPEPGATDSVVTQAAETVSELVAQWWEEDAVSGLVVDEKTRALRAGSLPTGGRPTVEAWPDPAQRYFPVEADGSTRLVVTVHRVEDAAGAHALSTLVLLRAVGRPTVLASSLSPIA
ncbi:hypothetical protein [Nocardioides campestrisoli]|uniref:hypothetical protein n=1 Tax=Nocardioides campestrisoli TaxID=2736757 RepID=UPI00163D4174|nr:hypothetical protein [Nocardioides campestrisoli]